MSSLSWDSLIKTHRGKKPFIIIHGAPKIGKTTLVASAPRPIIIATEDGLGWTQETQDVPAFRVSTYADFMRSLDLLCSDLGKFDTVGIDSLDHLEPLLAAEVCRREGKPSLDKVGYGQVGVKRVADLFREEAGRAIHYLQTNGKIVIGVAHSASVKENPPDAMQGYSRWSLKLEKHLAAVVTELADGIFYASEPIMVTEVAGGFNQKSIKATSVLDRRLYLRPAGAHLAGGRFSNLPEFVPLKWEALAPHIGCA
jgi:hypothetical protein